MSMFFEEDRERHMEIVARIKSWTVEFKVIDDGWHRNELRFADPDEARGFGSDIYRNSKRIIDTHLMPSADEPNAAWDPLRGGVIILDKEQR